MRRHAKALGLLHVARARLYRKAGRPRGAARAFQAALRWDDANPRRHVQLASALEALGQWGRAADAYEAALARDDRNARWHARLGQARARTRRWEQAAAAYEAALARDDGNARWHAQLGRVRTRTQRWAAAAASYEAAARRDNGNPNWLRLAAWAREQAGRGAEGERRRARRRHRARQAEVLGRDPAATDLDRRLLAAHPGRLRARREIARMVAEHIDEIRGAVSRNPRAVPGAEPRVFTFWAQGMERAPAVVRRCHDELRRLHSEDEVVLLDSSCVGDYVKLPDHVTKRIGHDWTKVSDMLRLELLSSYGGVWMDATCLPRVRLTEALGDLVRPSGFFAFTRRRASMASWLLAAEPDHYVVAMMREAHYEYWRNFDHLVDYYVIHHIFEALYHVDERFHSLWHATPMLRSSAAIRFKNAMLEPGDPARFGELLDSCFVHKLSYKSDPSALERDTMLARLVREGPPPGSPSMELAGQRPRQDSNLRPAD